MHAVLRSLNALDLAPDTLDDYVPPERDDFGVWLTALVGPDSGAGEEQFGVMVCSPKWLAKAAMTENGKGYEFVRHRLVVNEWDPALIRRAISDLCLRASGHDWQEVAAKLSRYLAWEFEDYAPK